MFLFFVADYGEDDGHRVTDALDTAVGVGMVGACGNFVDAEALIESAGDFGPELKAIVGKERNRASRERDVAVD